MALVFVDFLKSLFGYLPFEKRRNSLSIIGFQHPKEDFDQN